MLIEEYVEMGNNLRDANQYRWKQIEFKKVNLPRYGLLLGHNNETQLCLVIRSAKTNSGQAVEVVITNRIYKGVEINK